MIHDRLRVFVSSKMAELAPERIAVKGVLDELNIDAWVFEKDAGARTETIQEAYKEELEVCDLYLGIFWKGHGDYTIDEFEHAQATGKDRLVYLKGGEDVDGRDPELVAFVRKISEVESGVTIQWFETPEDLAALIKRDAARWQMRIVRKYRARASGPALPMDPNLVVLRNKVNQFWIAGVAGRAFAGAEAGARAPGDLPWEGLLNVPGEESTVIEAGTPIIDIYDELEDSVLIVGRPGSGKTTAALQITRELLARSERDGAQPIPVVFNLSAWTQDAPSFMAWLTRELSRKYQIPEGASRPWLEHDRLVLVLDGLDELASNDREPCLVSLNEYCERYGFGGLVLTGGLDEHKALSAHLPTNGTVSLQPLGAEQIDAYLEEAGDRLAGLRAAVKEDAVLRELARSPLMLNVMSVAYEDRDVREFRAIASESAEHQRDQLFATYIERAFERPTRGGDYTREATISWLSRLAKGMTRRDETMFLIEDIQPRWLKSRSSLALYLLGCSVLLGCLLAALVLIFRVGACAAHDLLNPDKFRMGAYEPLAWISGCVLWVFCVGASDRLRHHPPRGKPPRGWRNLARRWRSNLLVYGALAVPLYFLIWWSQQGFPKPISLGTRLPPIAAMVIAASALALRRPLMLDIRTTESLRFTSWSAAGRGARWGLLIGVGLALQPLLSGRPWHALVWWLVTVQVCAIVGGYRPVVVKGKTVPNQGMRLTWRTAVRAGRLCIFPVTTLLIADLVASYQQGGGDAWKVVAHVGMAILFFFAIVFLWFGGLGYVKHLVLRAVIGQSRGGPWHFARLLNDAVSRQLLQRVGGGYLFTHRLLRDHFAAMDLPRPDRDSIRAPRGPGERLPYDVVAMIALAFVGAGLLAVGLTMRVEAGVIVGAILCAVGIQWLVIRSAMTSALRAQSDSEEL